MSLRWGAVEAICKATVVVAVALTSVGCHAQYWGNEKERLQTNITLMRFAQKCTNFGFTKMPAASAEVMEDRLLSYVLLNTGGEQRATIGRWDSMFLAMRMTGTEGWINRVAQSQGNAVAAAIFNPASYDQAREKFADAEVQAYSGAFDACKAATDDPYIGANYVGGSGSLDGTRNEALAEFDGEVEKVISDVSARAAPEDRRKLQDMLKSVRQRNVSKPDVLLKVITIDD